MTRCDYDGVFYRVFCVTLLAIALTFTVILTNVFIDIDGLLTFKGREKAHITPVTQDNPSFTINDVPKPEFDDEDKDYEELDDNYRTKRSLESQNVLFHITNPKMKTILTSKLAKLLEKLDEEEPISYTKNDKDTEKFKETMRMGDVELLDDKNVKLDQDAKAIKDDNFLHMALHNILLQGMIEHMDINDIYKRIHSFMKNFNSQSLKVEKSEAMKLPKLTSKTLAENEESKFLNELLNCKELQDQVKEATQKYDDKNTHNCKSNKGQKLLINTVIDIKSMIDDKLNKKNATISVDNIKGIIKLIYNGKSIKINHIDDVTTSPIWNTVETTSTTQANKKRLTEELKFEDMSNSSEQNQARARKSFINKILNNYFKQLNKVDNSESAEIRRIKTKRLKRHVRIRYENVDTTTEKPKSKKHEKDDELYVEIETHFDSKGMKDENKKKLIRSLIQKIQKALHESEDINKSADKKKKQYKHLHVKKRTQNRLDNSKVSNKIAPENTNTVIHRQLNPISKTVASHESVPNIYDNTGESWKKTYTGPGFLTPSKSINSAERNEVEAQYSKLMNTNDIAQRMQKPINTIDSEEDVGANSYLDLGNLKFLIKEIDGTGFSVGFNQYVDEPPDADTIKLFTGLENIIQTYHQKYDPVVETGSEDSATEKPETPNNDYESAENSKAEHVMVRRSIRGRDYHSNEYKEIYDSNYLPYKNYQEIYDGNKRKVHSVKDYNGYNIKFISKDSSAPFIVDEDIFKKDLKPAEIFGLANLLDRKKRGTNVKHIMNLKSKIKMNKYLNTKTMATKKIFLNKKRLKREINKIRIIASDSPHQQMQSDENIFVVSDENIFADRAIVREMRPQRVVEDNAEKIEEQHYDVLPPYVYEESKEPTYITHVFDGNTRHNALMSKYPHIFLDEISRSKEQYVSDSMYSQTNVEAPPDIIETEQTTTTAQKTKATEKYPEPIVDNVPIAHNLAQPKTNYKLTVKIIPKNLTDSNTGFKEVHTSINESYKKNGMMYSSLVNVSEISKIIKLNKTKIVAPLTTISPIIKVVKEQQSKINVLLKQHKYRIDEQLQHLNREKQRLESMLAGRKETQTEGSQSNELVDLVLSKDPLKVVRLTKEQIAQLAAKALSKTQGYFGVNNQITTAPQATISTTYFTTSTKTVTSTTTTSTTATSMVTTTEAPTTIDEITVLDKLKILNTVEKNDKLTNEILKKIDKNTEILQTFLSKLLDSIPHMTRKSMLSNDVNVPSKISLNEPMNWKDNQPMHDPIFYQAPNTDIKKNNNHVSIPFVYAYQQPYNIADLKSKIPVQNIVYQGHIHTNTITNKGNWWNINDVKPKPATPLKNNNTKRDVNQTRFFVDELENDFKIIPLVEPQKKTKIYPVPNVITSSNVTIH